MYNNKGHSNILATYASASSELAKQFSKHADVSGGGIRFG